jgi:hypothetical protein
MKCVLQSKQGPGVSCYTTVVMTVNFQTPYIHALFALQDVDATISISNQPYQQTLKLRGKHSTATD